MNNVLCIYIYETEKKREKKIIKKICSNNNINKYRIIINTTIVNIFAVNESIGE